MLNNPLSLVDPSGLWCSAAVGDRDTPCNPGNSGGGGGNYDPFQFMNIPVTVTSYFSGQAPDPLYVLFPSGTTSAAITFGTPPGFWQSVQVGTGADVFANSYDVPLEGWGNALKLVGQNVNAQYAFLGKFAVASSALGAGGAGVTYLTGTTTTSGLASLGISRQATGVLAAATPVLPKLGTYLFAQGNNVNIAQGILNANNYMRMGLGFNQGMVFRMALGSKSVPLPAWIPGVVRGVLHLDLWWY